MHMRRKLHVRRETPIYLAFCDAFIKVTPKFSHHPPAGVHVTSGLVVHRYPSPSVPRGNARLRHYVRSICWIGRTGARGSRPVGTRFAASCFALSIRNHLRIESSTLNIQISALPPNVVTAAIWPRADQESP